MKPRPVVLDYFSGAGGMSLGFEQAGFDVIAAVEYDPVHAATHMYNFPRSEILCRDVRRLSVDEVRAAAQRGWRKVHGANLAWDGKIDAIVGGPSCQGFSVIGNRDAEDERNRLLEVFVNHIVALRPLAFCIENVPGLMEARFTRLRTKILGKLKRAGYLVTIPERPLDAAAFGVPQTRKRVLIVGSLDRLPKFPSEQAERVSVGNALDGLPRIGFYDDLLYDDETRLSDADQDRRLRTVGSYGRQMAGLEEDQAEYSYRREWDTSIATNSRRTRHGKSVVDRFTSTEPGKVEPISRAYRLHLDRTAHTLRAGTGRERGAFSAARPIHPEEARVITVREAARLHSFPDWFRFHTTNWHGHRQIGNSVPPRLARAVGSEIAAVLNAEPSRPTEVVELGDPALLRMPLQVALARVAGRWDEVPPVRKRDAESA